MKYLTFIAVCVGALPHAQSSPHSGQAGSLPDSARVYLEAQVAANDFMGAVLVERGGEPVFRAAYGSANLEHGIANRPETRFRIGSISKMFTAAVVHSLVESDAMRLDMSLDPYFDDIPVAWKAITIEQLLNHRSGILDIEQMDGYEASMVLPTQPRLTMMRFYDVPLLFEPGTRFEYSSSGYVVLAALIEQLQERSYEDLLRERVLDPLQLVNTGHDRHATILPHRASGYTYGATGLANAAYIDMDLPIGGGELYSTVDDLAHWARELGHGVLFEGDVLEAFFAPEAIEDPGQRQELSVVFGVDLADGGYSNGWATGMQHGRRCRQHGGVINGFSAYLARFPEEDVSVVVLSNTEDYFVTADVGVDLAALLFGEDYEVPEPRPDLSDSLDLLESYCGTYEISPGVSIVVTREKSQLMASIDGNPGMALLPRTRTQFDLRGAPYSLNFLSVLAEGAQEVELDVGAGQRHRARRKQ